MTAIRAGTSFSPRRCARFGLDVEATFRNVLALGVDPVRLSAYWDTIRKDGFGELDRLLDIARDANRSIVLTVGMKAIQWPEFYLPDGIATDPRWNGRIGLAPKLADSVVEFVAEVVARYQHHPAVTAWQVENEPFNRSGPDALWIEPGLVRRELEAVRRLDGRPIVLNAFNHFDRRLDGASRPPVGLFRLLRLVPEREILRLLGPQDVLGLDVYTAIGLTTAASDWADRAGSWLRAARRRGRDAWIIEAQAEPWEESGDWRRPLSFAPDDMGAVFRRLAAVGYSTILLWGCEYWFWRAAEGDQRWVAAARATIRGA